MYDHDDLRNLGDEIQRLLAAAIKSDARHEAELQRRDDSHSADTERRDQLHVEELGRRDQLHVDEIGRRDQEHVDELGRRDEIHLEAIAHLSTALESRDLIGQAKGVIIATMGCSSDEAFRLLKEQSQHENRKVVDIAAEIVGRAQRTHARNVDSPSLDRVQAPNPVAAQREPRYRTV
jgi:hypothetical protein